MKLEDIGFTRDELKDRLIEKLAEEFWVGPDTEYDGVKREVENKIRDAVKAKIDQSFKEIVTPNIDAFIEKLTLQPTNRWGEPLEGKMTFREYLVKLAEEYITETVSFDGKSKREDSYNWKGSQTRIAWMIHNHLQYNISTAVQKAMENLNKQVSGGIAETVKLQLADVLQKINPKVTV